MNIKKAEFKKFNEKEIKNNTKSNLNLIKDVEIPITLKIGETKLTIEEIQKLKNDSLFSLNKDISDLTVDIMIKEQKIGTGEVVSINGEAFIRVLNIKK